MSHPEPTTLTDVVVLLAAVFERLGIPYAFGGALATSFWGVPRTTQDADCLISVPAVEYQRLADALAAAGFLIDEPDGSRPIDVATLRRLDLDYVRRWSGRILEEDLAAELESMIAEYGGDESRDPASR